MLQRNVLSFGCLAAALTFSSTIALAQGWQGRCVRVDERSAAVWYDCNPASMNCGRRDWTADYGSTFIVEKDRDNSLFVRSYRYPSQYGWLWALTVRRTNSDYCE
jgi:hypothetical protein